MEQRDIDNSILFLYHLNEFFHENLGIIVILILLIQIALVIYVHFRTQDKTN